MSQITTLMESAPIPYYSQFWLLLMLLILIGLLYGFLQIMF